MKAATLKPAYVPQQVHFRLVTKVYDRALDDPHLRTPVVFVTLVAMEWMLLQLLPFKIYPETTEIVGPFLDNCDAFQDPWRAVSQIVGLVWAGTQLASPTLRNPRGEPVNLMFSLLQPHARHDGFCAHPDHAAQSWCLQAGGPRAFRTADVAAARGEPERWDVPPELVTMGPPEEIPDEIRDFGRFEVKSYLTWFLGKLCKVSADGEWLWIRIKEYHPEKNTFVGIVCNGSVLPIHGLKDGDHVQFAANEIVDVMD